MTARIDWLNVSVWGAGAAWCAFVWAYWGLPLLIKSIALLIQYGGTAMRGVL